MLKMKDLREFRIPFVGLKDGKHEFDYRIDNTFFSYFDYDEFHKSDLEIKLDLTKKPNFFELVFHVDGIVNVDCDRSGEPFDLQVSGSYPLIIKFGEEFEEVDEELLIIPHSSYELELGQYVYEFSLLSVPLKRVSPGAESLEEENFSSEEEVEKDKGIDPRWNKLNELITGKKA